MMMRTRHFRLIFKRSQSETSPPTFLLLVTAEMSPAFVRTAQHYGQWNAIVYADPKLTEAREQLAAESAARARKQQRSAPSLGEIASNPLAVPNYLTPRLVNLLLLGPFKLAWWIWCAIGTQRGQILRLYELQNGKVIAANTLTEISQAETAIQEATEEIENYLRDASVYDGHAFEPERSPP